MGRSATATQSSGGLREFLNSSGGKSVAIGAAVIMLLAGVFFIWRALGPSDAEALSREHVFVDSKTGKPFNHELKIGDVIPVDAPSGGKTGYPAELCFWTKDGKEKQEPTAVLLNSIIGKPGATFCPDCGRLVRMHNPRPGPNVTAPPTEAEYKPSNRGRE